MLLSPSQLPASKLLLLVGASLLSACGYGMNDGYGGYGGTYGAGGMPGNCPAGAHVVTVGAGRDGMSFTPASSTVHVNDTVCWVWLGGPHSVVSGTSCSADGLFCSPGDASCAAAPAEGLGMVYTHKFTSTGTFPYFCGFHCAMGMVGSVTVVP